jgi:Family of unknown function (DUF5398)
MFGLEKQPKGPVQFDLEIELKEDPAKANGLNKVIEERIGELKTLLRQGVETEDFDDYGVLLHGYAALKRVVKRLNQKK